jgi:hypothetical protein
MFDDVWVEVYRRSTSGVIEKVLVCDKAGQRIELPITNYKVDQGVQDPGIAQLHIFHGRVEYKDA